LANHGLKYNELGTSYNGGDDARRRHNTIGFGATTGQTATVPGAWCLVAQYYLSRTIAAARRQE